MAWEKSDRRAELPPDWPRRVAATKAAAGGQCEARLPSGKRCPRPGTDCDHRGDPLDHNDLQWLCPEHHKKKTSREAYLARQPKGSRNRRAEDHPGGHPR